MEDLVVDLDLAIKVAGQAGELARMYQDTGFDVLEEKENGDPHLTNADVALDTLIYHRLLEQTPSYGWVSEESSTVNDTENKSRVWVVDPIDGTKCFIKGISDFVISIALLDNGYPMLGVIYNPMKDQMFYCLRGHGVFLNDQQVITENQTLSDSYVLSPIGRIKKGYTTKLVEEVSQHEEVGSIAYRMALVAAGQADITYTAHPISLWDIAAGIVMLEEQGLSVLGIDGQDIDCGLHKLVTDSCVVAAREEVFPDILEHFELPQGKETQ